MFISMFSGLSVECLDQAPEPQQSSPAPSEKKVFSRGESGDSETTAESSFEDEPVELIHHGEFGVRRLSSCGQIVDLEANSLKTTSFGSLEEEKQYGQVDPPITQKTHLDRRTRWIISQILKETEQMHPDARLEHVTRHLSLLTSPSMAPDPPEFDGKQWHYKQLSIPAKVRMEDECDQYSEDLSLSKVDDLIDGDVDSKCNAVKEHNEGRQYLRDIILGVNDGLVSTFLLVSGVRGGGFSSRAILLSAVAGAVAGAVSMCAGEFVATKSQNELNKGEIATEERHIRDYKKDELMEVPKLLKLIGIGGENRGLQRTLLQHYARDPQALLKIMVALEFGFLEEEERSPFMAGFVSFFLFLIGAFPSVFPFMIPQIDPNVGFIVAGVSTCIALLIVGAVKTWATKGNCLSSAMENLIVAGFGGAVAFGAGALTALFIDEDL